MTSTTVTLPVRIQLLHVPDCPLLDQARETLRQCLASTPVTVEVEEREGRYPSPTLLINGIDVTTGAPPADQACCRFDLPTCAQINQALQAAQRPDLGAGRP